MNALLERVNTSAELAEIPLLDDDPRLMGAPTMEVCTPTIAIGAGLAAAAIGAFAAGYAVGGG